MKNYYIALIVLFAAIAAGEYVWLSRNYADIKAGVEERTKEEITSFVRKESARIIRPEDFSETDAQKQAQVFEGFWKKIQASGFVRIKAWNKNLTVVWSDLPQIIGQRFSDNHEVEEALDGETGLELTDERTRTTEYFSERQYQNLLEIYVPILDASGNAAGVIEVYQSANSFLAEIQADFRRLLYLWGGLGLAVFAVLSLALHPIFKRGASA